MPTIYSFSLDTTKHKHFIEMLETTKNRSALLRHALQLVHYQWSDREYVRKLERLVRTYCDAAGYVQPNLTKIRNQCIENNETKEYSRVIDLLELLHAHQEDHNSLQEQE